MGSEAQSTNFFQETEIWTVWQGPRANPDVLCWVGQHKKSRHFTGFFLIFIQNDENDSKNAHFG